MGEIDPRSYLVEFAGKQVPLSELAHARDFVRQSHMALDPVPFMQVQVAAAFKRDGTVQRAAVPGESYQIIGYASVYKRKSHDLGGFREIIEEGAFDPVLDRSPDVHAVWDHDTTKVLARTLNNSLELSSTPRGLRNWMQVAPTSYAEDLRILMSGGYIDQQSFAFTVEHDRWEEEDGAITRYVGEVRDLFDVTITAQGAYPQTSSQVVRSMRSVLDTDRRVFSVPEIPAKPLAGVNLLRETAPAADEAEDRSNAPDEVAVVEDVALATVDASETETLEAEVPDPERELAIRELKAKAEQRAVEFERLKERLKAL